MVTEYQTGVWSVTEPLGPLYYAEVGVEGVPSEATATSFNEVYRKGGIPSQALLELPENTLRDYNHRPIPIGALVNLTFT